MSKLFAEAVAEGRPGRHNACLWRLYVCEGGGRLPTIQARRANQALQMLAEQEIAFPRVGEDLLDIPEEGGIRSQPAVPPVSHESTRLSNIGTLDCPPAFFHHDTHSLGFPVERQTPRFSETRWPNVGCKCNHEQTLLTGARNQRAGSRCTDFAIKQLPTRGQCLNCRISVSH